MVISKMNFLFSPVADNVVLVAMKKAESLALHSYEWARRETDVKLRLSSGAQAIRRFWMSRRQPFPYPVTEELPVVRPEEASFLPCVQLVKLAL